MQQYTKQQLEGSVRYTQCLVGNWSEDSELKKTILKDFTSRKETGTLIMDRYQNRMAVALAGVELTRVRDDPYVHFGDVLQVLHAGSGASLATDVEDKDLRPEENACAATASSKVTDPCARNTFLLAKYKPPRIAPLDMCYDDDVLHYGQKIRLLANPMVLNEDLEAGGGTQPLCLFSRPVSTTHFAKYSRHQLVGFTTRHTYDTVWQVVTPEPSERVASQGVEVMAGAPVLLLHCATKKPLCLESSKYPNDFGIELEVSGHVATGNGLPLALEHTVMGRLKGSITKTESNANHWVFAAGTKVATLPCAPVCGLEVQDVLHQIADELLRSSGGFRALELKLTMMDQKGNGDLPASEFLMILHQVGLKTHDDDVAKLAWRFPTDQPNVLNTKNFLATLQPLCRTDASTAGCRLINGIINHHLRAPVISGLQL